MCWVATFLLLATAGTASALKYSLWVHGRVTSSAAQGTIGGYNSWGYWGGTTSVSRGVNPISVNWRGYWDGNVVVRNALDCYCTGANWCYIAAHSAGANQVQYALANYKTSTRTKKNAGVLVSGMTTGECTSITGTGAGTQTGWNIYWVDIAGSAGGGSPRPERRR